MGHAIVALPHNPLALLGASPPTVSTSQHRAQIITHANEQRWANPQSFAQGSMIWAILGIVCVILSRNDYQPLGLEKRAPVNLFYALIQEWQFRGIKQVFSLVCAGLGKHYLLGD
jgi:hypothetical protein